MSRLIKMAFGPRWMFRSVRGEILGVSEPRYGFVKNVELTDEDGDGLPELAVKFDCFEVEETLEVGDEVRVFIAGSW